MKPTQFKEQNGSLLGGPAESFGTGDDVGDLPVYRDGVQIVSCWGLTWKERFRVLLTGRVWLRVLARQTHNAVVVDAQSPFKAIT